MGGSLKDLIFECHALGVIFLEPLVGKLWRSEYLEVVDVAYFLGGIDRNPDRCHWACPNANLYDQLSSLHIAVQSAQHPDACMHHEVPAFRGANQATDSGLPFLELLLGLG
jgi:hypothetical protein